MDLRKNVTVKRLIGLFICMATGLIFLTAPVAADAQDFKESISPFPPAVEGWTPIVESMKFSEDYNHMAYVAKREKSVAVVLDGKVGPAYDAIGQDTPVFSPDSKRMAYKAKKGGVWRLVVDGKEMPPYDAVSPPRFSRKDSTRMVYVGQKGTKQCLVGDGRDIGCYDGIAKDFYGFSRKGTRWAAVVNKNKKQVVIVDGKEGTAYDTVTPPLFSHDDRRVAHSR